MAKALSQYCEKVTLLGPVIPYQIFLGKFFNKVTLSLFNTAYNQVRQDRDALEESFELVM